MVNLYVASLEPYSGKTAVCLALGLHYKDMDLRVKYMKPVSNMAVIAGRESSWDADFLREKLDMKESPELISPVLINPSNWEKMLETPESEWADAVVKAHQKLSKNTDLMLLEGAMNLEQGYFLKLSAYHVAPLLDAKVLLITSYRRSPPISYILAAQERLAGRLAGVIVNRAPKDLLGKVTQQMQRVLGRYNIPLVAVLPENKLLYAVSVNELAEIVKGEVICAQNACDNLVENFSVGAMNAEQALTYFRRISKKAVITGGDRVDIQLAALETDTRCLILTGNRYPAQAILNQAAIQQVPVIIVRSNTMEVVQKVDEMLGHIRLRRKHRITYLRKMFENQPGLIQFSKDLGLSD